MNQVLEGVDQLKVRRWCDVVVPAHLVVETLSELVRALLKEKNPEMDKASDSSGIPELNSSEDDGEVYQHYCTETEDESGKEQPKVVQLKKETRQSKQLGA